MTLLKNPPPNGRPLLPDLLEKTSVDGGFHFHFKVPENLYFFQGHFERVPVVAGVCQLKWVHDLIALHFDCKLKLTRMEAVKFHQLLFPGESFEMDITHNPANQKWSFQLTSGDKKISSGRLLG